MRYNAVALRPGSHQALYASVPGQMLSWDALVQCRSPIVSVGFKRWSINRIFTGLWSGIGKLATSIFALCAAVAVGLLWLIAWGLLTAKLRLSLLLLSAKQTQKQQTAPKRSRPMRTVQLTYMELEYAENTAAVVRFTAYARDGKAETVRQFAYDDSPAGVQDFEQAVQVGVANELDMTILSCYSPDYFPVIQGILED